MIDYNDKGFFCHVDTVGLDAEMIRKYGKDKKPKSKESINSANYFDRE